MPKLIFLLSIIYFLINWSGSLPINIKSNSRNLDGNNVVRDCKKYENFAGSNLFDGNWKKCFSPNDIILLIARKEFEMMIPDDLLAELLDDTIICHILRYFYHGVCSFPNMKDKEMRRNMEKAFYDTLGGFLQYYLVPLSKMSFYASKTELNTVRNVIILYQKCRNFLNTNGNGWRLPISYSLTACNMNKIKPIILDAKPDESKCCKDLKLNKAYKNDHMLVLLPQIEIDEVDGSLSNIWLPFSKEQFYNLRTCKSAFILLKYYGSVSRCYKNKMLPRKCFDRNFRQWIIKNVEMHLSDEQFYPGLGGILNILKTLPHESKEENNDNSGDKDTSLFNKKETLDSGDGKHQRLVKRDLRNSQFIQKLSNTQVQEVHDGRNNNDLIIDFKNLGADKDSLQKLCSLTVFKCQPKRENGLKYKTTSDVALRLEKPSNLTAPHCKKKPCTNQNQKTLTLVGTKKKGTPKTHNNCMHKQQNKTKTTATLDETKKIILKYTPFGVAGLLILLLLIAITICICKKCKKKSSLDKGRQKTFVFDMKRDRSSNVEKGKASKEIKDSKSQKKVEKGDKEAKKEEKEEQSQKEADKNSKKAEKEDEKAAKKEAKEDKNQKENEKGANKKDKKDERAAKKAEKDAKKNAEKREKAEKSKTKDTGSSHGKTKSIGKRNPKRIRPRYLSRVK